MNAPRLRFKSFKDEYINTKLSSLLIEDIKNGTQNKEGQNEFNIKFINVVNLYRPTIHVDELNYIDKDIEKLKPYLVYEEDLFYTRSSLTVEGIAHCNIYLDKYSPITFDDHIMRVRVNKKIAYPNFIKLYSLSSKARKYFMSVAKTGTMTTIGQSEINNLEIKLPSYKEQVRISEFFSKLALKIQLQQEKIDLLKKQKEGYMQKIFKQELRFKGENGEKYPKWIETTIGETIDVGSCLRVHQKDWTNTGVPFYRARDIVNINNGFSPEPLHISNELYNEKIKKSGPIQIGDVMITGVGTIGVPYLIERNDKIYFKDGNVVWLKNNSKINGKYLYYYLLSEGVQRYIKVTSGLGTVGTYTIENAKKTPLKIPCLDEQLMISNFLSVLDKKIKLEQQKLEEIQKQKQGFMQEMFI